MATGEDQMQGSSASIKCERKSKDDVVNWKCIIDETVIYMSYRYVFDHPIYPLHLHLIECLALQVVRRCTIYQGANEVALSVVSGKVTWLRLPGTYLLSSVSLAKMQQNAYLQKNVDPQRHMNLNINYLFLIFLKKFKLCWFIYIFRIFFSIFYIIKLKQTSFFFFYSTYNEKKKKLCQLSTASQPLQPVSHDTHLLHYINFKYTLESL
ncbi:hypothetical protein Bca52824_052952 [Brassica carinata]|uniref:Uncharacterized protein n=1 Tax=Brassica carinata TaxID=52824 RepID=A0A8X7UK50_BRACI|nr:hypothetical protein Bca52824_052952 [Brassica carinata]